MQAGPPASTKILDENGIKRFINKRLQLLIK